MSWLDLPLVIRSLNFSAALDGRWCGSVGGGGIGGHMGREGIAGAGR